MGKIDTGFTFSHQVFGEGFYTMELLVRRLSDSEDRIPVMVSERLLDITQDYTGQYIEIHGQFRSYNRHEEKHNRLVLSDFCEGSKILLRSRTNHFRSIRSSWMDLSVSRRSTEKRRLAEKLQICFWQ
mgnify:CR=1 FL=1